MFSFLHIDAIDFDEDVVLPENDIGHYLYPWLDPPDLSPPSSPGDPGSRLPMMWSSSFVFLYRLNP